MRTIIYLFIVLLSTSCSSTYFFSTLNTNNIYVEKVDNGDFLLETDSLWIAYCFKGESAPVQITVFNKTDKPLFIDWQRSSLIIGDVAHPYTGNRVRFSGDGQMFTDIYHNTLGQSIGFSDGGFTGSAEVPVYLSFVPPRTMVSHIPLRLDVNFENINKKLYKKGYIGDKNSNAIKINRIDFKEADSPLLFKSYLTIYAIPDKPMIFEQNFYMSNLIKTASVSPKNLPPSLSDRGDLFYTEKPANTTFLEVLAGTAIVVGAVAVEVIVDSKVNN